MRRLLPLCLLLAAAPAAAQEFPYAATVAADGLPVHAGPLESDYVTTTLPRGARVTVARHDPGGRAMVRAPEGAVSFAKLDWLTMTAGTPAAGGTATVTAAGGELYCRVGSRVGEAPVIEQIPLRPGQEVTVLGVAELPGEGGPERWAKIPSPAGEHRWVQLRYLAPDDPAARAARDLDPYAVPAGATEPGEPAAAAAVTPAGFEAFDAPPAGGPGSGPVELAFEPPRPLTTADGTAVSGGIGTGEASAFAEPVPGAAVQVAAADPFGFGGAPLAAPGGAGGLGNEPGWQADPTATAARFAPGPRGPEAVALDRRRLDELDAKLDALPDAPPTEWDLDEMESDLVDLRDRAGSKSVRRLAAARLERVTSLRLVRDHYTQYVTLTAATDRRDAVLTAEAGETLRRFAEAAPSPNFPAVPHTATAPALPAPGVIQRMSHERPAGGQGGKTPKPAGPPGAVAFDAVGVLREVAEPAHAQAPRFALVSPDGRVTAYLKEDPRLNLPGRVGGTFGVSGRRFRHPAIAAPMIAVTRLVPVRR